MKPHPITFPGFRVEANLDWEDVTEKDKAEPFTLAKAAKPLGALQFSAAIYRKGPLPLISPAILLELVEQMGQARGLGAPLDRRVVDSQLQIADATYKDGAYFIKIWYVSDGKNILYATYVCDWNFRDKELLECESIIRSVRFDSFI